ncbi:MAG: hypothetical protein K0S92_1153, partial [Desertimonas sp.]|nr:hypothetical protein [Desertimonas sp.]
IVAATSTLGKRWVGILRTLRPELPGEWSLRGGGMKAMLMREPIGWAIPWIGCSKASSVRTHAGVAPAVWDRLNWLMGAYGLDMADVPRGPRAIELGTDGDLEVARTFVGHAIDRFEELTPARYAAWSERSLQLLAGPELPKSTYLLMAPGWRIVNDSGDPVDAAEACIDWAQRRWPQSAELVAQQRSFYEALISAYKDGGRDDALAFLTENRDRQLVEQGYDSPSID